MATKEHFYEDVLPFFNLKEYWDNGYKGKGVVVASVEGTKEDSHGENVKNTVLTYAPECTFLSYNDTHEISAVASYDGFANFPNFVDWCIENKVDIVTSSLNWDTNYNEEKEAVKKLYDNGIIFVNSAGNKGSKIEKDHPSKTWGFDKEIITVSGISFTNANKYSWSGYNYGEAVDVCTIARTCPTYDSKEDVYYVWSGTSAATPMCAGMLATYKSYDKTLDSHTVWNIIDNLDKTCDYKGYSHKIFILPKYIEKEIEVMEDKDEKLTSEWAKASRKKLMELGLTDGTRPKDNITREEVWTLLDRLIKLYE